MPDPEMMIECPVCQGRGYTDCPCCGTPGIMECRYCETAGVLPADESATS